MEQHPVPQNVTSFEFKIVGFLTLKQFAVMGTFGVMGFIAFISLETYPVKILALVILVGTGVLLTFGQVNNIAFSRWLLLFIHAVFSPTERIWIKSAPAPSYLTTTYAVDAPVTNALTFDNRQVLTSYLQTLPHAQRSTLDAAEEQRLKSLGLNTYQPTVRGKKTTADNSQRPTISSKPNQPPLPPITPTTNNSAPQTPISISHMPSSIQNQPKNTPPSPFTPQPQPIQPTPTVPTTIPPVSSAPLPTPTVNMPANPTPPKPATPPPPAAPVTPTPEVKPMPTPSIPPQMTNPGPVPTMPSSIPNIPEPTKPQVNNNVQINGPKSDTKEEVIVMDPKIINQTINRQPAANPQQPANMYQMIQRLEQQYMSELQALEKDRAEQQESLSNQLKDLQSRYDQLQKQLQESTKATAAQSETASQNQKLMADLNNLKNQVSQLENTNNTLTTENQQLKARQAELTQSSASLQDQEKRIQELQATIAQQQTQLSEKDNQINTLTRERDTLKQQNETLTKQNQELQNNKTQSEQEKATLKNQLSEAQQALEAARTQSNNDQTQKVADLETQLGKIQTELAQTEQKHLDQVNKLRDDLKAEINKNEALEEKVKKLSTPAQTEFKPHLIDISHFEDNNEQPNKSADNTPARQPLAASLPINHEIPQNNAQTLNATTPEPPQKRVENDRKIITDFKTAQIPTITNLVNVVSGIVYDKKNNILQNAIIIVKDADKSPVRALKSNRLGQFAISTPLPNGIYTIEVEDSKEDSTYDIYQISLNGSVIPPIEIKARES